MKRCNELSVINSATTTHCHVVLHGLSVNCTLHWWVNFAASQSYEINNYSSFTFLNTCAHRLAESHFYFFVLPCVKVKCQTWLALVWGVYCVTLSSLSLYHHVFPCIQIHCACIILSELFFTVCEEAKTHSHSHSLCYKLLWLICLHVNRFLCATVFNVACTF